MKNPGRMIIEVLKSLFKKPATVLYPSVKSVPSTTMRGKLKFYQEKCIGCKICERDCPADAITVRKIGEKLFEVELDLGKCIYCAQCVDSCPKDALGYTDNFELAVLDKNKMKVLLDAGDEKSKDATSK